MLHVHVFLYQQFEFDGTLLVQMWLHLLTVVMSPKKISTKKSTYLK